MAFNKDNGNDIFLSTNWSKVRRQIIIVIINHKVRSNQCYNNYMLIYTQYHSRLFSCNEKGLFDDQQSFTREHTQLFSLQYVIGTVYIRSSLVLQWFTHIRESMHLYNQLDYRMQEGTSRREYHQERVKSIGRV